MDIINCISKGFFSLKYQLMIGFFSKAKCEIQNIKLKFVNSGILRQSLKVKAVKHTKTALIY